MSREQVKYVFQIGFAETEFSTKAFRKDVIAAATRFCGGCTTSEKTGWWRDDGDQHKAEFVGNLERETCFEVELTCELHKAADVYSNMCDAIAIAAMWRHVKTDWVHVTETPMVGRHFSVKARAENFKITPK